VGPVEGEEVLINGKGGRIIVGRLGDSLEGVLEGVADEAADEAGDKAGDEATDEATDEVVAAEDTGPAVAEAEAPSARV
jgi:hypothetical protein